METRNLQFLLDRPIAYHRCFVTVTGSVNAAIMLSQALYWSKRTTAPNGWFWKTQEEWEEETGLTRYEQEGARKLLKKTGFWNEKLVGVPATLHFEIDYDVLDKVLSQTSMRKNHKLDVEEPPNQIGEKPQTKGTEITSENTTEITHSPQPPINCGRKSAVSYAAIQFALEKFWAAYPRKQNKVDVERAFVEVHAEDNLGDILKALEWQCRSDDWNRDGGRFIPTPANYLRDHRWLDQNTDISARRKHEKSAFTLEVERFCARPLPE